MTPIIPLATAFAVLLHSLLGCCMHHDHRGAGGFRAIEFGATSHHACSHNAAPGEERLEEPCELDASSLDASSGGTLAVKPSAATGHDREACPGRHQQDHHGSHSCEGDNCSVVFSPSVSFVVNLDLHWIDPNRTATENTATRIAAVAGRSVAEIHSETGTLPSQLCVWLI